MHRTQFIIATAVILFVAFCLGWFANWLVHRFIRVNQSEMGELDRMAQEQRADLGAAGRKAGRDGAVRD